MLALFFAQEDMIDGFQPLDYDTVFYWQIGLWLLCFVPPILACGGISRYLRLYAEAVPWKALRFWLPVLILAVDFLWWAAVSSTQADSGGWLEGLGWISGIQLFALNLPGLPLALALMWVGLPNLPGWLVTCVMLGEFAISWNLFLRWVETRALQRGPLSLFGEQGFTQS